MAPLLLAALFVGQTDSKPHALIMARTVQEKAFIKDAATFLVSQKMTPITLDELNAMLEAERVKDLAGCTDVACLAEITGAYGVKYVLKIKADPNGTRAVMSLHDQSQMGKTVAQQIVSKETAVEKLLSDVDDYNRAREKLLTLLKKIPCGYPWSKLEPVIGYPHNDTPYKLSDNDKVYYDITISVFGGVVKYIKEGTSGKFILGCK